MTSKQEILLVEDESGISNFITAILESNDYKVIKTGKGSEAIAITASQCPDLILLDLGLPDMDGLDALKNIRSWSDIPIIIISARTNEREKVHALDLGADDYVTKPFGTSELLARIRTAIRHKQKQTGNSQRVLNIIVIGGIVIDNEKRKVTVDGNDVHLTPVEYRILLLLATHAGKVLTLDMISKEIWGPYTSEHNALRVNMANIRRKIEANPAEPLYIKTEVGVGYKMVEEL